MRKRSNSNNNNQQNNLSTYNGIKLLKETNFSTSNTDIPMWTEADGLPIKPGDQFPTQDMQRRANINMTMDALVSGDLADTLSNFIYTWPDLDPITNRRVSSVVASLPLFNTIMRDWELLLHSCIKGVRVNGEDRPLLFTALDKILTDVIENKFTCCDRLLTIYADGNKPLVKLYSDKNIFVCRDEQDNNIYSLTNIFKDASDKAYLEVISFMPNNTCLRNLFEYGRGRVGIQLVENEPIDTKADVHFERNGAGHGTYGQPILGGTIAASLGAIRAFSTLTLLVEKKREVIRVVPDSSIETDEWSGMSAYVGGGTISYKDNNPDTTPNNHDVKFVVPEMNFKEAIDALDTMLKQVSIYSNLSGVILGYQTIGGNASGQAIAESCLPTMIAAAGYLRELKAELTHVVKEMLRVTGEEVHTSEIEIVVTSPSQVLVEMINLDATLSIK